MSLEPTPTLSEAFDPVSILHDVAHLVEHLERHISHIRGELPLQQSERLIKVDALVGRLRLLCQTGLIGARMAHGRHSLKRLAMPLAPMMKEALETVRPLALQRNIALVLETERRPSVVLADPAHFPRVLENLLLNAIEATPPGSTVCLSASSSEEEVTIQIMDEGPGFDPGHLDQSPVGFGLDVARALVSLHEGTLKFTKRSPRGTTAEISMALSGESVK